ncbi:M20/M25/M40 family metallo-hydrolase [Hydrogenimonas sp.]
MIDEIIGIFVKITKIPHCSKETEALREYIMEWSRSCGYETAADAAGNVAAYCAKSRITLQVHYDMVCVGRAPDIEPVIEDGWMKADGSSLGADNGIGVAIMLYLMQKGAKADFLFTNDEEIGLIGANNLALGIRTSNLLNLDSEEFGKIYIGCAGGEDLFLQCPLAFKEAPAGGVWYELLAHAPGGHSGVNIADGIPNAITLLSKTIWENQSAEICSLKGGERINAIPRLAEAVVVVPEGKELKISDMHIEYRKIDPLSESVMERGRMVAATLFGFAHGVRGWNRDLNTPQTSINLAMVDADGKREGVKISLSGRAMDNEDLGFLSEQTLAGFDALGFTGKKEGKYPAWKPEINAFSEKVRDVYEKFYPEVEYAAIHAGLECAIFSAKFPTLKIASIGPTILDPHSDRERVELASVESITKVVEAIIADLSPI